MTGKNCHRLYTLREHTFLFIYLIFKTLGLYTIHRNTWSINPFKPSGFYT